MKAAVTVTVALTLSLACSLTGAYPGKDELMVEVEEPYIQDVVYEPETLEKSEENSEKTKTMVEAGEENGPETKISYTGSQLWKVAVDTDRKRELIGLLRDHKDVSMWGGNITSLDILVKPTSLKTVAAELARSQMRYEIIIEDLQTAIDSENPPLEDIEELEHRKGHRLTWQAYHRLSDIHGYLDYLATSYPSLCSVRTIGQSAKSLPIKLLKISNGNSGNKAVWIDGGIHAREWISPATVTYVIDYLVDNFESLPESYQKIDYHIVPVVNPDGYEYSHTVDRLWRKNRARSGFCSGTDLNRNFGYRWGGKGASRNPCQETYGGSGAFSEPETSSLMKYITSSASSANWKAYITFHSYGQYILFPWGYDKVVPPDYKDLQRVGDSASAAMRSVAGASYTVGAAANTLYPASGGSDDWAKGSVRMKYAYTIELRDTGRYGFVLPASYIIPTAKEGLAAVKVIVEAASAA